MSWYIKENQDCMNQIVPDNAIGLTFQQTKKYDRGANRIGAKIVHLNAPALAVLSRIERVEGNPYVIVGQKSGTHLVNLKSTWQRIRKKAELEDVRLHDLRHSFASIAVSGGFATPLRGGRVAVSAQAIGNRLGGNRRTVHQSDHAREKGGLPASARRPPSNSLTKPGTGRSPSRISIG